MIGGVFHLALHFLVPAAVGGVFYRANFLRAWATMCATMLIDIDHLLANPVYDAGRCSIGFHPLHTAPAIGLYGAGIFWPKTRLVAIGLMIHILLDGVDCVWMGYAR